MENPRRFLLGLALSLCFIWIALGAGDVEDETSDTVHESHDTSSHEDSSHDTSHASSHGDSSHDTSHASSHESVDIFVLGDYFDYDVFIILLIIVGGCALLLDLGLARYEEWLRLEGDTFQSTLKNKIVRELMTLGIISFVLYLFQPVMEHDDYFITFEFCHYVIFFMAVFTVAQLILLGYSTYPIKRAWDIAAFHSKEEVLSGYRSRLAQALRWTVPFPRLSRVSLDVFHLGEYWKYVDRVHFHIARSVFIRQMGQSADFDFARYACLVTDRQILSMANPPLWSWAMLILAHWAAYGVRVAFNIDHRFTRYGSWLMFGVILLILELGLLYACLLGMKRICVKLGADRRAYRSTLDVVLQGVWVAPITHMQQSRSRRASSVHMRSSTTSSVRIAPAREDSHSVLPEEKPDPSEWTDSRAPAAGMTIDVPEENSKKDLESKGVDTVVIPEITIKDAFLLNTVKFHKILIRGLMMLNSFYLAFFAVYHIGQATHQGSSDWIWIIILPLPVLIGTLMAYRRVLPLFSLLSAVVIVKASDVALVGQEVEETNKVRRKLVLRIQDVVQKEFKTAKDMGEVEHDRQIASFLISRWDMNDDRKLSYAELERGLSEFGLVMSRRQRRELLRLADPDRNGEIDIDELADFLYDIEVAMAAAVQEGRLDGNDDEGAEEDEGVDVRLEHLLTRRASSRLVLRTNPAKAS